jgi:poly-gamma-glutamate capsule biosynthesis protein CapA/YwtB (metallophosphatase superfamily)
VRTLKSTGIAFAGAGETRDEAIAPVVLRLAQHEVHVWAAADHPRDWHVVPNFHLIDYTQATKERLKKLIEAPSPTGIKPALKVFSVHWGPNYAWNPADQIRDLAHYLVDNCGIDIVHGHSSHHVQGIEAYNGRLIIYGCGDFVDDYALVAEYRNDLSGIWSVQVVESTSADDLQLGTFTFIPTKIDDFRARLLEAGEVDTTWVLEKVKSLSAELGTNDISDMPSGKLHCDL